MTLLHFRTQIMGKHILMRSDSMSVVTYLNKMGGTHSLFLCIATWHLLRQMQRLSCTITSTHVAGISNKVADSLSRVRIQPTEWMLNPTVAQSLFHLWDYPLVDLFASDHNFQIQTFCSWMPSQKALQIDAFTLDWTGLNVYAFPPICLIPCVLRQIEAQPGLVILIAPCWPRRAWFSKILELLADIL